MQTNLQSDNFCGYNNSASEFFWIMMPNQYSNTYAIGEIGIPAGGGMGGAYVRPEEIDVSSFLSGRDDILSKCTPPVPSLASLNQNQEALSPQPDASLLLPKYTKELRSANAIDSVDYNRWQPNQQVEPQNLRYVIEDFANQRGGFNSRNYVKSAWSNQNNSPNYDPNICKTTLDPNMMCGTECSKITGYPGVNPLTGQRKDVSYVPMGKPQPDYPFTDITSQQINSVGASSCGPQFFSGQNYDQGSCPPSVSQVFKKL